jgi:hypothetical protein
LEVPNSNPNLFQLSVDSQTRDELQRCAYWARISAIIAFISAGLSMIFVFINPELEAQRSVMIMFTGFMTILSIVINVFLYRFGTKTTTAISNTDQRDFNEAITGLQTYFKIQGILIIIILSIMVLAIPVFIIFVSMGMSA